MEDGFRLQEARIAIVGLGLMGGSLALALRGKCAALYGVDRDPATLELARVGRVVDEASTDPAELLRRADVVILAAPVPAIVQMLHMLSSLPASSCIVLDLGSTKQAIVEAMAELPQRFEPIGGHPICGKETLGLENAEATLFREAPFVVTPLKRTTPRARQAAEQIIAAVGARPIEMAADEHDRALAFTSHLPFLLASALALSTPQDYSALIGSGFRSTSRVAGTPTSMMMGVIQSNRTNLLEALRTFRDSLQEIESLLMRENDSRLKHLLNQSRSAYRALISNL